MAWLVSGAPFRSDWIHAVTTSRGSAEFMGITLRGPKSVSAGEGLPVSRIAGEDASENADFLSSLKGD
jgi:hypothetical protein